MCLVTYYIWIFETTAFSKLFDSRCRKPLHLLLGYKFTRIPKKHIWTCTVYDTVYVHMVGKWYWATWHTKSGLNGADTDSIKYACTTLYNFRSCEVE